MQRLNCDSMEWLLISGLVFSLNVLYLVICAFVMMRPEDVSDITDAETDTHRAQSAVVVNSLVLGVLGLFLFARLFSAIGDRIVDLLYQIVTPGQSTETDAEVQTPLISNTKPRLNTLA